MHRIASRTALLLLAVSVSVAAADPPTRTSAVRVLSPRLADALSRAALASPTLRGLLRELDRTDVIVHVTGRPPSAWPGLAGRRLAGATRFVVATRTRRYVRVTVDEFLPGHTRAAVLAHELWHALEVARAPHVVDQPSFAAYYRRIGHATAGDPTCFDTKAAVAVGVRVRSELRRGHGSR